MDIGEVLLVVEEVTMGVTNAYSKGRALDDGVEERVVAEVGKGRHRGPRITPAIPELGPNPVILLS